MNRYKAYQKAWRWLGFANIEINGGSHVGTSHILELIVTVDGSVEGNRSSGRVRCHDGNLFKGCETVSFSSFDNGESNPPPGPLLPSGKSRDAPWLDATVSLTISHAIAVSRPGDAVTSVRRALRFVSSLGREGCDKCCEMLRMLQDIAKVAKQCEGCETLRDMRDGSNVARHSERARRMLRDDARHCEG